jgi:hypothetical protein
MGNVYEPHELHGRRSEVHDELAERRMAEKHVGGEWLYVQQHRLLEIRVNKENCVP